MKPTKLAIALAAILPLTQAIADDYQPYFVSGSLGYAITDYSLKNFNQDAKERMGFRCSE